MKMKKFFSCVIYAALLLCLVTLLSVGAFAADLEAPEPSVVSVTEDEVSLAWAEVQGAEGYKIYSYDRESITYTALGSTKNTYYTAKNLEGGTEYTFVVRPFVKLESGARDFGKLSEGVAVTTRLSSVEGIVCDTADSNSITLSWSEVKGAVIYRIKVAEIGSTSYRLVGKTQENCFTLSDLEENSGYKFRISAGDGEYSTTYCTAVRLYTAPEEAAKPKTASVENGVVKLKWEEAEGASYYYIYSSLTKNGTYKRVGKAKTTSYNYKLKDPDKVCYIKIAAVRDTAYQTTVGEKSEALRVKPLGFAIKVPAVVRSREYPEITVPGYGSKVKWSSSDPSVIKVSGGRLYACGQGTATITARYKLYSAKAKVKVSAPVLTYRSCVFDVTNGKYIFASRINERCYPASITKLITALVALKYMKLTDTIVVGNELNMVEPLSSRCGIQKGEKFKLGDILYGLLLPSGGDAAYTIAVNCARKVSGRPNMGYVEAKNYFVSLMNSYMKSIGAKGTHLVNPHGYPVSGHYTTVSDLCLVAQKILKNKTLKTITSTPSKYVTAKTGRGRTWTTTNSLIKKGSSFYSPYSHGMKTGTVDDYYTGIVSAATKNGRTIITVAIGCESYNARYVATRTLYNYYL